MKDFLIPKVMEIIRRNKSIIAQEIINELEQNYNYSQKLPRKHTLFHFLKTRDEIEIKKTKIKTGYNYNYINLYIWKGE